MNTSLRNFLLLVLFFFGQHTDLKTQCNIFPSFLGNISCQDNGTPYDPNDDTFTFEISMTGNGVGDFWTADGPGMVSALYDNVIIMGAYPQSLAPITITITDNLDPSCTFTFTVAPDCFTSSCSIQATATNYQCNNQGTSDPFDDTFTVDYFVTGSGTSTSGWISDDLNNTSGSYDVVSTAGPFSTAFGTLGVTISDVDDPSCNDVVVISSPGSCSNNIANCNLLDAGLGAVTCNDFGTPGLPSDDYLEVILNPTGTDLGTNYIVTSPDVMVSPGFGSYGSPAVSELFNASVAPAIITLIITDADDPSCSLTITVNNIAPCSSTCSLAVNFSNINCLDNGTPNDQNDDLFTFDVFVSGVGIGSSWFADDPNGANGNYNSTVTIGPYPIAPGSFTLTITDIDDPGCNTIFTVPAPASCSFSCDILQANLTNLSCNDNNTPFDPTDDFILFTLNPGGNDLGSSYFVTSAAGPISPAAGVYGAPTDFSTEPGTAGNGDLLISLTDVNDNSCSLDVVLPDPGSCAVNCTLDATLGNPQCNDNGTPTDPTDDVFTIDILVEGNNVGDPWTATDPNGSSGLIGQITTFGPYPIADGPFSFFITDINSCQEEVLLNPPANCSISCLAPDMTFFSNFSCNPLDTGVQVFPLQNALGCDSLVIVTTALLASDTTQLALFSCDPTEVGVATETLMNGLGCDSLVITTTSLLASDLTQLAAFTCDPAATGVTTQTLTNSVGCDSLVITTTALLASDTTQLALFSCDPMEVGIVTETLTNALGCDSLVITTTALLASDTTQLSLFSCDPAEVGMETETLTNALGCDSLVITTTALLASDTTQLAVFTCDPTEVGVETETLTNALGCDSLVITATALLASDTTQLAVFSCDPTEVGVETETLTNALGCDSLVIRTTSLLASDTTQLSLFSCDPTEVGIATETLTNALGCDSLVIITTALLASDTTQLSLFSCDPTEVGIATETLTNGLGCDSLVITTTALLASDTTQLSLFTCNPTEVGIATETLTNTLGCDSLVITATALLASDTTQLSLFSCDPTEVGMETETLTNTLGCDSLVITTTALLASDTTQLSLFTCDPTEVGEATDTLTNALGCDSLVIRTTALLASDTTFVQISSCDLDQIGTTETLLTNLAGCDSLLIIRTDFLPLAEGNETISICAGETLDWNGLLLSEAGTYQAILETADGCDSIANLSLRVEILAAEIIGLDPSCQGNDGRIQILDINGGEGPYALSLNGQAVDLITQTPFSVDNLSADNYQLILESLSGCIYSQNRSLATPDLPFVDLGADISVNLGEEVLLTATTNLSSATYQWRWIGQDTLCVDCPQQVLVPPLTGTYSLTVTDEQGCSASDQITIFVDLNTRLFLPNVFSPNGDGINDRFFPFANPDQIASIKQLQIFDRWGESLFSRMDFPPNTANLGWDGFYRGQAMPPGVYVYYLEAERMDGQFVVLKGSFTLVR